MKAWFLDAKSVYPLLTSQVHQKPGVNLTTACMFSSVAKKAAGGWEGIRSPNEIEAVTLARMQTTTFWSSGNR
jgi:hypothetical protein